MAGKLSGKTCLVTGAAQGIGHAIATQFAVHGGTVLAADLRFDAKTPVPDGITQVALDVTSPQAIADLTRRHPDIAVLVNCVGMVTSGTILECSLEEFDRSMAVNVRSMVLTIQATLPAMLARGDGSIINIASVVSSVMAAPNRFAYASAKAAVIGLTMSVARDFIDRGIRCNAISPGTVESPSLQARFAATGDADAARAAFVARQPMGRLGQPDEIAAAALLLGTDDARFMTGSNIIIDGGMAL
ncbi:SDR family oxidoreductase [Sphingomonas sp.]|uniref:SDR family oxidoreductase n=1 Tax=Sphingomonas sp. TaxID=28214 RepID=UPI0031D2000A